jgi:CubicO group peptidase (beta-lactamase class C family)
MLATEGLTRLHDVMSGHVEAGELPGLVTLVARGDDVHVDAIGTAAFTDPAPLAHSTIFRIASLSKPIAAVAAMALIEEGILRLDQPVDELLPELARRRVLRAIDAELDDTVPAVRSITVEDLLSYRFGIGSVMAPPGAFPIQRAEAELGLQSIGGPPWPPVAHDVDSWIAALGTLPLMYQPGERWLYNTSGQVLGVLLARATGSDLETLLRERVFEPLGMSDTSFTVPAEKLSRLATAYAPDPETDVLSVLDDPANSWWGVPPSFPDASGWLVSTIDDYWTFVSMLLAGGTLRGARILSPESVALMTTDRLTASQREGTEVFLEPDDGWGLGLAVPAIGSTAPLPCGIGWDGGIGTTWRSNRTSGVTGIALTQRAVTSPVETALMADVWTAVNAATQSTT